MKVVLYARVSSERQAEKDISIPSQLKAMREYAAKRSWEVRESFVDEAESARSANRPAFQKMISLAKSKNHPFEAILVWKLSRFARNREDSIIYKALLRKHGVQVISVSEPLDDSPAGKMLEGMIEVIDEFYSANLAQETLRGMTENASQGFLNGSVPPFGYRVVKVKIGEQEKSKLAVQENEAAIAKRIFKMSLDGMGTKEIAKALNAEGLRTRKGKLWSKTVLYSMLTNETYTGYTLFNRYRNRHVKRAAANHSLVRVKNTHPAIIDETPFQRVQEILRERGPKIRHPRTISSDYLLSGLGFCKNCGAKLIGATAKSGRFFYYGCQNYLKKGKQACDSGLVNREKLEQSVVARIKERILTDKNLTDLVKMVNEELARLKTDSSEILAQIDGQLDECTKRLQRLFAAVETGKMELDDLAPRIRELKQQIEQLQSKRRGIETENVRAIQVTQSEIQHYVEDLRSLLMTGTLIERKSFLRSWIRRVEFSKSAGGEIEYCLPLISTGKDYENAPDREVLSIGKVGSAGRTRTRTPTVRLLDLTHRPDAILSLRPVATWRPQASSG